MKTADKDLSAPILAAYAAGRGTEAAWQRHGTARSAAWRRLQDGTLAVRGREDWVHGNAAGLLGGSVLPLPAADAAPDRTAKDLADAIRLVFIDGIFAPARSALADLPDGVVVSPLGTGPEAPGLGEAVRNEDTLVGALNTMFWRDGLRLEVAAGVSLRRPVELQFLGTAGAAGVVPVRNLVQLGAGSRATLVERFVAGADGLLELPLTEVVCGRGAGCDHIKIIGGAAAGEHCGATHVVQQQDSVYRSWEIVTGGRLARREIHLRLREAGAACDLNALFMGAGEQRFDLRTRVDHDAPDCRTRELYKGILNDRARGVFDGLIRVARDSQRTSAHQTNRNLLLSDDAVINSIPRLEIYADDVKCSHGSTTGQLDEKALFYLRTRGFSPDEARAYLAWAFASEVVGTLPVAGLRDELSSLVTRSLDGVTDRLNREPAR